MHFSYPNVFHTLVQVATDICVKEPSYDKHDHEYVHQQPENQERPHHSTVNKMKTVSQIAALGPLLDTVDQVQYVMQSQVSVYFSLQNLFSLKAWINFLVL